MNIRRALATIVLSAGCSPREHTPATTQPSAEVKSMSFHAFSAAPLGQTEAVSLTKYKGQVLLVANTAAHCGYTPQYTPLGEIDRRYGARGFKVLGFVSDDFGHQAGTVAEVQACSLEHRATFDQFAEVHVKKGPEQHPLFAWLTSQPGLDGEVAWNFNKFLIGKGGELLGRWPSKVAPDGPEITGAIEAALAK
jgi:glutathione peroxidase